jgi:hypothetical protein
VCMAPYRNDADDAVLCFPTTIRIDADGSQLGTIEERMDLRQVTPHARFRAYLQHYYLSNCFYGVLRSAPYGSTRLLKSYDSSDMVLLGELALRGQFWQLDEPLFLRRFHVRMSHKANPTPRTIRSWQDTSIRDRASFPRIRMFWEFLRAIDTTDLSTAEKMRCRRELGTVWLPKKWKSMVRELVESVGIPVPRRT